jgi:hypothetical protein
VSDQLVDTRIRQRFASEGFVVADRDLVTPVLERVARRRRRRRVRRAAGVIGCAVLAAAAVVVLRTTGDAPVRIRVTTNPGLPDVGEIVTDADGVAVLPAPPLVGRIDRAVVWTGRELVVWGGDGAAYEPSSQRWRTLAPSPLPSSTETPVAAMTDRGVVIARGRATALWDPDTNQWRRLDDAPFRCAARCSTTGVVKDLTSLGDQLVSYSASAMLDVHTGHWTELPLPPRQFERFAVAATGRELIVVGGDSSLIPNTEAFALNAASRAWRTLPPPPNISQQALAAVWDGTRVVVVDYAMHTAALDSQSDSWSEVPSVPARFSEWSPFLQPAGGKSIAFMADTIAVLDTDDAWTPLPYGIAPLGAVLNVVDTRPFREPTATPPPIVFVIGLGHDNRMTATAIDVNRVTADPPRLQVGAASIAVPLGFTLTASQSVDIRLDSAAGTVCNVASTYVRPVDTEGKEVVTVQMGDRATDWYRTSDGTHWETAATTSDTVIVECSDPETSEQLVRSADLLAPP